MYPLGKRPFVPSVIQHNWGKIEDRKHGLHDGDDQSTVDGRTPVRVSAMPHEEFGQVAELDRSPFTLVEIINNQLG
jgi:hypothetical protein